MGVSVAFAAIESYVTVAGTSVPPEFRSSKVEPVTVAGSSASLKVAVTVLATGTSVAPAAGVTFVTVGAVVSRATATPASAVISAAVSARL